MQIQQDQKNHTARAPRVHLPDGAAKAQVALEYLGCDFRAILLPTQKERATHCCRGPDKFKTFLEALMKGESSMSLSRSGDLAKPV